jgi:acyl carrier protein
MREMRAGVGEQMVAYRGRQRWVQSYEPVEMGEPQRELELKKERATKVESGREPGREPGRELEGEKAEGEGRLKEAGEGLRRAEERWSTVGGERRLRERGVYLITGGLGGVGLIVAEYLMKSVKARVVLIGREGMPEREEWERWVEEQGEGERVSGRIRRVQEIEREAGEEIMIERGDVGEEEQMREVVERVMRRYGEINGVIHAAGFTGEKTVKLIPEIETADCELHFRAKVYGVYVLEKIFRESELDFCLLFSSNAAILGGLGSVSYAAANLFMDSFASTRGGSSRAPWMSVNWDGWLPHEAHKLSSSFQTSMDRYAMTPDESLEAFRRVVCNATLPHIVVSKGNLFERLKTWIGRESLSKAGGAQTGNSSEVLYERPLIGTKFVPPGNQVESVLINIWQKLLGIKQIGIHDNFFDLGGNSLIGLKVISRVKQELKIEIAVLALFEGPTVSALAKLINQKEEDGPLYEESRSRGERRRQRRRQQLQTVGKV